MSVPFKYLAASFPDGVKGRKHRLPIQNSHWPKLYDEQANDEAAHWLRARMPLVGRERTAAYSGFGESDWHDHDEVEIATVADWIVAVSDGFFVLQMIQRPVPEIPTRGCPEGINVARKQIEELRMAGTPRREISRLTGIAFDVVRKVTAKLRSGLDRSRRAAVVKLWRQDHSQRQIVEITGIGMDAVRRITASLKPRPRMRNVWKRAKNGPVIHLDHWEVNPAPRPKGLPFCDTTRAAKMLGVSKQAFHVAMEKHGVEPLVFGAGVFMGIPPHKWRLVDIERVRQERSGSFYGESE